MAMFIFSHAFVSIGVNIGLLPVTGLPFPFLSSGGSNYLSVSAGLGILQSIKRYG
jgi:cell division protein FtsW (lipid II flippase)